MAKQPKESDHRWGVKENPPAIIKPYVTTRQIDQVSIGDGKWLNLGEYYGEIPTKNMSNDIKVYHKTGYEPTMQDRIGRMKKAMGKNKKK